MRKCCPISECINLEGSCRERETETTSIATVGEGCRSRRSACTILVVLTRTSDRTDRSTAGVTESAFYKIREALRNRVGRY